MKSLAPLRSFAQLLACSLAIAALVGCGDDRAPAVGGSAALVGPAGGAVRSADGALALKIPAGALSAETRITVRALPDSALPPGGVPGTAFELLPEGLTFNKPVEIALSYPGGALPSGADSQWLRVVQVLPGGKIAPTQHVAHRAADGRVVAHLAHFSQYALANLKTAKATTTTLLKPVSAVDVLFVIDNSGSMAEEQAALAASFAKLVARLDKAGVSYRIGVTTSDLGAGSYGLPSCTRPGGDGGRLLRAPAGASCPAPSSAWIERRADGTTNVPGDDITAAFSCIARVGTAGCGFEQPLEAAHRALTSGVNPGFLRNDAVLAVVYITDEDDCSAKNTALFDPTQQAMSDPLGPLTSFRCFEFGVKCDVNDRNAIGPRSGCKPAKSSYLHGVDRYVAQLRQLKPNGQVVVAAIAGDPRKVSVSTSGPNPSLDASCQSPSGLATPPVRIAALLDAFGGYGKLASICGNDYGSALDSIGALTVKKTQLSWCLPYDPVDTSPLQSGLQADCVVVAKKAGPLPQCTASTTSSAPCYRLAHGSTCGASRTTIEVLNASAADIGAEVYAICLAP